MSAVIAATDRTATSTPIAAGGGSRPEEHPRRASSHDASLDRPGTGQSVARWTDSPSSDRSARRPLDDGLAEFRVWAPDARTRSRCASAAREHALERRRPRRPRGGAVGRRRRGLRLRDRRHRRCPTRPRAGSPSGLRGPVAGRRHRRLRVDRRRLRAAPRSRDSVLYELHVGTFTARGHVRRRDRRTCAALRRARRHRASSCMPVAEFPGRARLGLRRRLPLAPRSPPTAARWACSGSSTPPTRAGSRVILDVVYNHVGASGNAGARGVRPLLHRQVRDVLGQGDQLRRRRLPTPCASGSCRAPRAGSATSTSTACASTRSTRSSTPAPTHVVAAARRARARGPRRRARHRRVAASTTRRSMRPREQRRLRLRRRSGPTTSTTRCACC